MDFREAVRDLYIDLDCLVVNCGLSAMQASVVQRMMGGASLTDIAQEDECSTSTVAAHLNRAVEKIVRENDRRWMEVYHGKAVAKKCK